MRSQIENERESVVRGSARYYAALEADEARGRQYDNSVGSGIIRDEVRQLVPAVRALQTVASDKLNLGLTAGTRQAGWELPIQALSAEVLSYMTVKQTMVAAGKEARVQDVMGAIGRMVSLEIRWSQARELEKASAKETGEPNRIQIMKRRIKEVNPRSAAKWLKRLDDLSLLEIPRRDQAQLGAALLSVLLEACPSVAERVTVGKTASNGTYRETAILRQTAEVTEALVDNHMLASLNRPWLLPMLETPVPWSSDSNRGGYMSLRYPVAKESLQYAHAIVPSEVTLAALNAVQATPWCVHRFVLNVAQKAVQDQMGPVPHGIEVALPESVPADTWDTMGKKERVAHKAARADAHSHNHAVIAKRLTTARVLGVADDFKEYPSIFFPYQLDWRGRFYAMPQDLNPQGDDLTKALLTFGTAKVLGHRGLRHLQCHVASTYGKDKLDRDSQELWTMAHVGSLKSLVANPFDATIADFWAAADKPWQFLAAAYELCEALKLSNPTEYLSSLPIARDGSCNGLQHLSAMGLDEVGGAAVNLVDGQRSDIYSIVAERVATALVGTPWEGHITRKTVKRAVMTTPYGLTRIGMREQLVKEGYAEGLTGDRGANYSALRDAIQSAIGETLVKGTTIMAWMQSCAGALAKEHNAGITWDTPSGNTITQSYAKTPTVRIACLMGRLEYADKASSKGTQVSARKSSLSVAPNIIHSFDAAHLASCVVLAEEQDCNLSYAMVHDSYAVHACDVDVLEACIRQSFVDQYSEDQFAALLSSFAMEQPAEVIATLLSVEVPERGSLDIEKVLDSTWFFA